LPHRGGFVTGTWIATAFAVGVALLAGPVATAGAASVVVHPVATGTVFAGSAEPAARIVRDAPALDALLAEWGMERARSRVGAVDFRRRSLIVLLDRARSDTGYVDWVGGVDVAGPTATLTATVFRLLGFHLDAFANPWAIVSVPRAAVARAAPELRVVMRCAAGARICRL
jgi:hypothetical protein